MLVKKLMHTGTQLPLITANISMKEALLKMTSSGFGCVGIIDSTNNLMGIITDGDLRRHMDEGDLMTAKVADIMTKNPQMIPQNILAEEALARMNAKGITCFFIVRSDEEDDRKPIGILHIHDCLRAGLV